MSLAARIHRRLIFPFWAWKDASRVQEYLQEAEAHQYLAPADLDALRWQRLTRLLEHAYAEVPYYRQMFEGIGCHPSEIRSWDDYARLPTLRRADMIAAGESLRARVLPEPDDAMLPNFTGGSTAEPARFTTSKRRVERAEAGSIRHDRWTGWDLGEPMAVLWGAGRDLARAGFRARLRTRVLERRLLLDAMTLDRTRLLEFVERLRRERPRFWLAYAGVLGLLLRFLDEEGIDDLNPTAVISSAELLLPEVRELAERRLGCRVFDRYGAREVSLIASECGQTRGHALHLNADSIVFELEGASDERPGKVIVTDLHNMATPFLRYEIGDAGRLTTDSCGCGRTLPLIAPVEGRTTDFLVSASGRVVSGVSLSVYVLGQLENIHRGQLQQSQRGEIRAVLVADDAQRLDAEERVRTLLQEWLGDETRVEVDFVDDIPPSASGKHRFCVSTVDPLETLT